MTYFKLEGHIRFENFISKLKKYLGMTSRLVKNQQGFSSHLFGRALVAIVFMLIGWLPSLAHDFEVDGVFYTTTSDNTVAVTYKGNSYDSYWDEYIGDVVIPSSVDYNGTTYSVTSIRDYAFRYCYSLTSIVIGNSVTSIGGSAFDGCDSLTKITCPVAYPPAIVSTTFSNYSAELYVPSGWIEAYKAAKNWNKFTNIIEFEPELEEGALLKYEGLIYYVTVKDQELSVVGSENSGNIIIPSSVIYNGNTYSVTSIGDYAFYNCSSLTSIQIPNRVTSIGVSAFSNCESLTSIEIPNSVTSIDVSAFCSCDNLTSIVVNAGNTKYDSRNGCNAIIETASNTLIAGCKNTIIPNSVTSIGNNAFYYCESLTSVVIGNSVTSIGDYAFFGCESLTSVVIGNSVTSIGNAAFNSCTSLTSIEIPNSVTSIGGNAFQYCSSLTSIQIPNSVTSIGDCAFGDCSSLTSIVVDAGNSIYDSRNDCNAIIETASNTLIAGCKNTIIPNSVTSIGDDAFYWCKSLTSIEIPNSVTSIGDDAFSNCESLASVVIGNSVTSIGNYAFWCCSSLTKITCLATTPPTIEFNTFSNYYADLYVPAGCKSAYQSANYWKNFNIKEIPTLSTSIALNKTSASLKVTETLTLVATVLPENATNKSVTWKSSNEAVATVDANGKVTAVAVGEATITATTTDGSNLSASCKVTVVPTLAESITLDKIEISLEATETATLIVTVLPELTTDKSVEWSSSNESVATIDANGLVTAIAVGEAIITATTTDGSNLSTSCKVTVVPTLAETITLDKAEISIEATETATLIASVLPELVTDKSVEWSSSNESVATIDANGLVTAIAVGEAIITATTTDGSNLSTSCKVTVVPTLAETITLDKTGISLEATETATLVANVLPELTTNKSVTWTSSNEAVATVDANGVVTAVAVGEAVIKVTTTDGSNLSASCKVTVVSTLAETITLDKTEISLEATETATLVATVLPELTTNKSVTWTSSNEAVATVDANGVVTAIAVGEATITATTTDGSDLSASCKVTVVPTLAETIALDKTEISLEATETATLVATVLPETATNKSVTWASSNEAVATVDDNGEVTAIALGEAIITATTTDGSDLSASCKVTVVPTLAETITLDKTEISLEATETATLIATVLPETATNKSVTWASSNEAVAIVDENGVVTAVAVGEATITATTIDDSNLSATCKVTVIPTLAVSIELDQTEASVEEKSDLQLTATILPEHATNKEVAWSSSDKWVATVDNTGLVTIHSAGEVIITATTTDGTNLSATCRINVYSGIDGVNGNDVIVATIGDNIVVKNAKLGSNVRVYAADGSIITSEIATDGDVVVEAPVKGIYIVAIDGKSFKVMVK